MSTVYFTEDHEWIQIEGDEATIGITNHAQEQLGDLVFVELPEVGSKVSKGDAAIVVESVKAASDVFSPVDGEILAVNSSLEAEPELVNASAEKDGWLVKIRLEYPSQLDGLLDQTAYLALVG